MKKLNSYDVLIENLRALLAENGMSEAALAPKSGVAQKTINNIMRGVQVPKIETVDALAEAFKLSGWQLLHPGLMSFRIGKKDVALELIKTFNQLEPQERAELLRSLERTVELIVRDRPAAAVAPE